MRMNTQLETVITESYRRMGYDGIPRYFKRLLNENYLPKDDDFWQRWFSDCRASCNDLDCVECEYRFMCYTL